MIFSKCGCAPGPASEYLVYAAPNRIDQRDRGIQRLARTLDGSGVAGLGADDGEIHAVGVDIFLVLAPAAELVIPGFVEIFCQLRALLLARKAEADGLISKASPTDGPGEGSSITASAAPASARARYIP